MHVDILAFRQLSIWDVVPLVVRGADEVEHEAVEYEGFLAEMLDMEKPGPTEVSPHEDYKEPEDESLFRKLLTIYGRELRRLEAIKGVVVGMIGAYISEPVRPRSDQIFPHLVRYGASDPLNPAGSCLARRNQTHNLSARSAPPPWPPGQIRCTCMGVRSDPVG